MTLNQRPLSFAGKLRKKYNFFKSYVARRPVWCSWQITGPCNFRCDFCAVWRVKHEHGEQSLEEIERSAARLAKLGTMMVSLTGGEPTLRKDLPDIVRAISQYHFAYVTTNGSLITPEYARTLLDAGLWGVGVSIDYADPERQDTARGHKGSYVKAVQALKIFQEMRAKGQPQVNLMFTLMHDNFDDLEKLAKLTREIGCGFRVQPYSTLKTGDQVLRHLEPVAKKLLDLRKRYPNCTTSPVVLEKFDLALNGGVPDCVAGKYMVNIDPFGQVSICPEKTTQPVGHILNDDTQTLLRGLREKNCQNTCQDCWYNCRSEVEVSYSARGMFYGGMHNFRSF